MAQPLPCQADAAVGMLISWAGFSTASKRGRHSSPPSLLLSQMLGFAHTNDSKPQIKSYLWLLECILMEISTINIKMPCGKKQTRWCRNREKTTPQTTWKYNVWPTFASLTNVHRNLSGTYKGPQVAATSLSRLSLISQYTKPTDGGLLIYPSLQRLQ